MKICVDTTVLIDVLKDEFREQQEKFYRAIENREELMVPAIVFAELMPQFDGKAKAVGSFLGDHKIESYPLDIDSAKTAAIRWMKYLKRKTKLKCPNCSFKMDRKEHILSEFFIGGFALHHCDAVLTRDRGVYKKYFPDLIPYDSEPLF